jgi:hypothetical protein
MDCKTAPIPADDAGDAPDAIAKEGYDLTHVLIGYAFAKEAGCAYPLKEAQIAAIRDHDSTEGQCRAGRPTSRRMRFREPSGTVRLFVL